MRSFGHYLVTSFLLCVPLFVWGFANRCFGQIELLEAEQKALKEAGDFAALSVVQLEALVGPDTTAGDGNPLVTFSGTVLEREGWIATSLVHLRTAVASIAVKLPNGERVGARVIARDFSREIALVKADSSLEMTAAVVSPDKDWRIGQWVIALGKAFDPKDSTRSVGILSARGRAFGKAFQIDAKVSPLNYGGPVADLNGRVMGILTPVNPNIATEGEVQQWYDSGVAFAIPLQSIVERLPTMKQGQDVHAGKIGIRPKSRDDFGGPITLSGVSPGSPAAKSGLKAGDVIKKIAGQPVEQMNQLRHALGPVDALQSVEVEYERDGMVKSVSCELAKEIPPYREPFFGFLLDPSDETKLEIAAIVPGSPAEKSGLRQGQIIERIEGETIDHRAELREILNFSDFRSPLRFRIKDSKSGRSSDLQVGSVSYPNDLPNDFPNLPVSQTAAQGKGIIELPLPDITNKAFAYVPTNYAKNIPHGLLLILPEAGEVQRKEWIDHYEPFCREHRWIMAVVSAANNKQWSLDEVETIQRIARQLDNEYNLDARRWSIGGLGTGGTLALVCAAQEKGRYRGVWLVESKIPLAGRFPPAEPMEVMQWMLIGSKKEYPKFAETMQKLGYPALWIEKTVEASKPKHPEFSPLLLRWLRRMEAY